MDTRNKNIYFLGDSITAGAGASEEKNTYVKVFASLSGANVHNYGVSGTRIGVQKYPTKEYPSYDENFLIRAKKINKTADLIIVFGGTNDWGHGDIPLGKKKDVKSDTFSGCLNQLCQYLIENFSKDKIVFLTPIRRVDEFNVFGEGQKTAPSCTLFDYVRQIEKIVKRYHIRVLDLYHDCLPMPLTKEPSKYFADGTHPNDLGHKIIAEKLFSYLTNKK